MSQLTLDPVKIAESVEQVQRAHSMIKETAFQVATGLPADLPAATAERLQLELAHVLRSASAVATEIDELAGQFGSVLAGFRQRGSSDISHAHDMTTPAGATQLLDLWIDNLATSDSEATREPGISLAALADDLLAARQDSIDSSSPAGPALLAIESALSSIDAPGLDHALLSETVRALTLWLSTLPAEEVPLLEIAPTSLIEQSMEHPVLKHSLREDSPRGGSEQSDELRRHALQRLEGATDVVLLIAPATDGQTHFLHTLLVDSGFGVFLTQDDNKWSISEPVSTDDVIWSLIDQIGTPSGAGSSADKLASVFLRRSALLDPGSAEELRFSGPVGSMELLLNNDDGIASRACSEEELFELLSVALGPAFEPPEWPTDPGSHPAKPASSSGQPTSPVASGGLNRISLAACESAAHESSASGWHRSLANPQIVARLEPLDDAAAAEGKIVLSIAADSAVQWQSVDGRINFEAFDKAEVVTQIERLLGKAVLSEAQALPEALRMPIAASRLKEEVTMQLSHDEGAVAPGVRQLSAVVATKEDNGLISGEELELIAIDRYGTFVVEPADSGNVTLARINAAGLTHRLVVEALA